MHLRTSSIWTKTNASLDEEWKELSQECVLLSHKCPAQLPGSCHDCEVTSCPVQKGSASLTPVAQSRLPRCLEGSQPNWAVFRLLVLKYTFSNNYLYLVVVWKKWNDQLLTHLAIFAIIEIRIEWKTTTRRIYAIRYKVNGHLRFLVFPYPISLTSPFNSLMFRSSSSCSARVLAPSDTRLSNSISLFLQCPLYSRRVLLQDNATLGC